MYAVSITMRLLNVDFLFQFHRVAAVDSMLSQVLCNIQKHYGFMLRPSESGIEIYNFFFLVFYFLVRVASNDLADQ